MEERESIQKLGGDMVVFYNAHPKLVAAWREQADDLPEDLVVVSDPDASLYEDLGTERASAAKLLVGGIVPGLKALREGRVAKATKADMQRLGADVAVGADGEIARLHLASSPDDRLPFGELVAALS